MHNEGLEQRARRLETQRTSFHCFFCMLTKVVKILSNARTQEAFRQPCGPVIYLVGLEAKLGTEMSESRRSKVWSEL